jgi:hypothetical protein
MLACTDVTKGPGPEAPKCRLVLTFSAQYDYSMDSGLSYSRDDNPAVLQIKMRWSRDDNVRVHGPAHSRAGARGIFPSVAAPPSFLHQHARLPTITY